MARGAYILLQDTKSDVTCVAPHALSHLENVREEENNAGLYSGPEPYGREDAEAHPPDDVSKAVLT